MKVKLWASGCILFFCATLFVSYALWHTQGEAERVIFGSMLAAGISHSVLLAEIEEDIDANNSLAAKSKIRQFVQRVLQEYDVNANKEYIAEFVKSDAESLRQKYSKADK